MGLWWIETIKIVGSAIIGGIITMITSICILKKENKKSIDMLVIQNTIEERAAFLAISDELDENRMNIRGYVNYMKANNKTTCDFTENINRPVINEWYNNRKTIYTSLNHELVKNISNLYKAIFGLRQEGKMSINLDLAENIVNTIEKLEILINILMG